MSVDLSYELKKVREAIENLNETVKELLKHLQEEAIHVVMGF